MIDLFALSADDTETEIPVYEEEKIILSGWYHKRIIGGVNGAEANSYFILPTQVMVLVD